MTVKDIGDFVASVDPNARHYVGGKPTENFTVWMERERLPDMADDNYMGGWYFEIHRLTRIENDPIAAALDEALNNSDTITYRYQVTANAKTGIVYHRFECEGY